MKVEVFDKSPYENPPNPRIQEMIAKLAPLGRAVIACRGDGFSANILGTVYIGKDGDDPVLRGKVPPPGECTCHVHIKWNLVCNYALKQEDVSYGPEPVIYLLDKYGDPIVRIFYPGRTFAEVEAVLA